ncbi:hypothetical protein DL771_005157 [Monosporascus sp. 5C6A]|nr:hypothetical protein DL771_005157 [Monosporascus sp. 5C6A]
MDPFSITVGALGITGFATSSIAQLRDFINGLAEAKDVVQDIASSLEGIERPLSALENLSVSDEATSIAAQEDLKKAGVAEAVNKCGHACDQFTKYLKKWTQHSSTKKLSLKDRFSVGVWNKEKIPVIQLRSEKMSERDREDLKKQLQNLETKIQEHLDFTIQKQDEARKRKQELQKKPEDEEDGGAQRTLAINEVEEQSCLLEADLVSCGVVFSQLRSQRTGQEIGNVITTDNSKALVGLPESVVGKVHLRIKDVTTQRNSAAVVGVFDRNVDMRDFFKTL